MTNLVSWSVSSSRRLVRKHFQTKIMIERIHLFVLISLFFIQINALDRNYRSIFRTPQVVNVPLVPPDHKDYVSMARYVVHQADWASIATISSIKNIKGYPFSSIASMSDGTVEKSIGVPYFYLTPLDFIHQDLSNNNVCTVSVTLEETSYCRDQTYDPDDPRCARVMLSGKIIRVPNNTKEYEFAKEALFSRHHSMSKLPADHYFYVAKLDIHQIVMLDWFGGPIYISIDDYLSFGDGKTFFPFPFYNIKHIDDNNI